MKPAFYKSPRGVTWHLEDGRVVLRFPNDPASRSFGLHFCLSSLEKSAAGPDRLKIAAALLKAMKEAKS